jgi:hypothetical protein
VCVRKTAWRRLQPSAHHHHQHGAHSCVLRVHILHTDKGIQTGPDSKYFAIYSEIKKPINNEGKELVLQVGGCAERVC